MWKEFRLEEKWASRWSALGWFFVCLSLAGGLPVFANHSLGTAQDVPAVTISPTSGAVSYSEPGAKFLMLRLTGGPNSTGDRIRIPLPYGDDLLELIPGGQVWSRPIPGNGATLEYVDNGDGLGSAILDHTGRGTIIDLFQLERLVEPTFQTGGLCNGSTPDWQAVDCLADTDARQSLMKTVAQSVGMMVMEHDGDVSSCSAALIDSDLILTSAHCVPSSLEVESGSFTLDFETDCLGNRPTGYNPKFYKIVRRVRSGFEEPPATNLDYAVLQIDTASAGIGAPPLPLQTTYPPVGDEVFVVHHPRGAPKKVSRKPNDSLCEVLAVTVDTPVGGDSQSVVDFACDIDNGSSGSPLLDLSGEVLGVNNWRRGACVRAQASGVIQADLVTPAPTPADVDVVTIFDRSGSMGLPAPDGGTKIEAAQEAAELFYSLIRTTATHQAGLVSFSHTVRTDHGLAPFDTTAREALIGPPLTGSRVGDLTAGGATTIGGGLERAQGELNDHGGANTPTVLLLTDGLQNTAPTLESIEPSLGDTRVCAVGFGSEASLNGPLLTRLARDHGGMYTRADRGLDLKKFFALCFGNIFESGISLDPTYHLHEGVLEAYPIPLQVCGESGLTVVTGWEFAQSDFILELRSPSGALVTAATPGVDAARGKTWAFLRLGLPWAGEQDGTWTLNVRRDKGPVEFPNPLPHEDFMVVSVIDGGPSLEPVPSPTLYTGDVLAAGALLRDPRGGIYPAEIEVTVERPTEGTGNLLAETRLRPARTVDGDRLDARVSTLLQLEQSSTGPLIPTSSVSLTLRDDGQNDEGALEADGQFGARIPDLLTREGHYGFHAKASFGNGCGTREALWSTYVSVGIDPDRTEVTTEVIGEEPDGRTRIRVTVTPRDVYGNYVGPGRAGDFDVDGAAGTQPVGAVTDLGGGAYGVDVVWDPSSGRPPGIVIGQPDRPGVELPTPIPAPPGSGPPGGPSATGPAFGLALGVAFPVGTANATYDPGLGARFSYRHPLAAKTSLVGALGYAGFDGGTAGDLGLLDVTLGGRLWSAASGPRFFVQGGVGYYAPESDLGDGTLGLNAGFGISRPINGASPMDFELSIEGHRLSDDEPDFLRVLFGWVVRR